MASTDNWLTQAQFITAMYLIHELKETPQKDYAEYDETTLEFRVYPVRSVEVGDVAALLEQYKDVLVLASTYLHYCRVFCKTRESFSVVLKSISDHRDWFRIV